MGTPQEPVQEQSESGISNGDLVDSEKERLKRIKQAEQNDDLANEWIKQAKANIKERKKQEEKKKREAKGTSY
jgi:hypothetical protein